MENLVVVLGLVVFFGITIYAIILGIGIAEVRNDISELKTLIKELKDK